MVTKGTRDVYQIGRGNRPEAYNIFISLALTSGGVEYRPVGGIMVMAT